MASKMNSKIESFELTNDDPLTPHLAGDPTLSVRESIRKEYPIKIEVPHGSTCLSVEEVYDLVEALLDFADQIEGK